MVLTSDVVLIARAAKKSLDSPNMSSIQPWLREYLKATFNRIENTPSCIKVDAELTFIRHLHDSTNNPVEQEQLKKVYRLIYRADLNSQMRDLERLMSEIGPEEVDLEETEKEKQDSERPSKLSDTESKFTNANQELTAVRKDFEEYKAMNDAKLEALEQKIAQMLPSYSPEDFDMSNHGPEDGQSPAVAPYQSSGWKTKPTYPAAWEIYGDKIAELEAALCSKTRQISEMAQEHEETVRRMSEQLEKAQVDPKVEAPTTELKSELLTYKRKLLEALKKNRRDEEMIRSLKNQLDHFKPMSEDLRLQVEELTEKKDCLEEKLRMENEKVSKMDDPQVEALKKRNRELASKLSDAKIQLVQEMLAADDLRRQVSDLTEERDCLDRKLRDEWSVKDCEPRQPESSQQSAAESDYDDYESW